MVNKVVSSSGMKNPGTWVTLAIAMVALVFSNGLYTVYPVIWIAPVFLIRFLRQTSPKTGIAISLPLFVFITVFTLKGIIPVTGKEFAVVAGLVGITLYLPYLIDRLLWEHHPGFLGTLVFPCAWVGFEYVNSLASPYSTWGSLVYTQIDGPLPFLQLLSITGLWGPLFLMTWFASIVNWIWENQFEWKRIATGASFYLFLMLSILVLGSARLSLFTVESKTTRIASIVSPFKLGFGAQASDQQESPDLRKLSLTLQGELLRLSRQAAQTSADIIFWSEAAVPVFEEDLDPLIQKAGDLASEMGVYLMLSLYQRPADYPASEHQNKLIMIDSEGKRQFEYLKSKPIPGEKAVKGEGTIKWIDTPFGRVGAVICYDMDFPGLIRQAGRNEIDIMLVPGYDWREIAPLHTYMASMRAIENGFSMVRSAKDGVSGAFDNRGRLLNISSDFTSDKKIMYSDVPIKRTGALYPVLGDFFAWLAMLGLTVLVLTAILKRPRSRAE